MQRKHLNFEEIYRANNTELDLSNNHLTDQDVKEIVLFLNKHPEITSLNLSDNDIGNDGAKLLAEIKTLTAINISYNLVSDEGANAFAVSANLKTLDITKNLIGLEGLKALVSNPNFIVLHALAGNKLNKLSNGYQKLCAETDPLTLSNYGRQVGVKSEVPTLTKLCLFNVKKLPMLDLKKLPEELIEAVSNIHSIVK